MFIFPDRENTENLPKITVFRQGIYLQLEKILKVLKINGYTRIMLRYFHDILTFVVNFELMNREWNEVTVTVVLRVCWWIFSCQKYTRKQLRTRGYDEETQGMLS